MSKVLKIAAVVVGVAALIIATGGAAAVGIGTAASSATAATATVAATAATAASVGGITASTLSLIAGGLSIAANLTAKRPTAGGVATQFKADPRAGIPYMMGRSFNAGNIIYRRTHNTVGYSLPDLQTFVVILSGGGPVQAIEAFTADDAPVTFGVGGNASGGFSSWMWQRTQLGAQPEAAALVVGTGGITTSTPPGWTGSHKLSGFAAAIWTLRYDLKSKIYSSGQPQPGWIVQGVKVYDPRLDSTYPGGSGSCRSNDESTFVYSENPYLHGLTFALGRFQNGKRVLGVGAPIVGIDVPAFVEGANVADLNDWKIGGVVYSTDNKWSTLKSILQAGGGEPIHLGAKLSCIVNAPKVTLATITTADVEGEVSVNATQPRRDRINSIIPIYRSEAHGWELIPAAPITVASHVTTDGGLRTREVPYPLVQQLDQAAQLARYDIENAREFGPIALPLKLRWLGYKPGDQLAVEYPEAGLNGQTVVVMNRDLDVETATVTLVARSETPGKHAFALGQTTVAPDTPTLTAPPTPPQPASGVWNLIAGRLTDGVTVTPALVITGSATDDPVDRVVFEYRLWVASQPDEDNWIAAGAELPTVARKEIMAVLPGTRYEVSVAYQLGTVVGLRRILGSVFTATQVVPPSFQGSDGATFPRAVASGGARDGVAITFPSVLASIPRIVFLYGGNSPTAGQNIRLEASGLTASGFTPILRSQSFTPASLVTDAGATSGGGGEPTLVINRSNGSAPFDGKFKYRVAFTTDAAPGSFIEFGYFAKKAGSWVQIGQYKWTIAGATGSVDRTFTPGAVDFGAGSEFGVSVLSSAGAGSVMTGFSSVFYTPAAGAVTETSLTPAAASDIPWEAYL